MNYILYGEDSYLLQQELDKILKEHLGKEVELNTTTYSAIQTSMNEILDDAMTIPFFSDTKAIVVQQANFLTASKEVQVDQDMLLNYVSNPLPSTILIFIVEHEKLDSRKKLVKEMMKYCCTKELKKLDEEGKARFIRQQIKERTIKIEENALTELIHRLPTQLQIIEKELDKLQLYGEKVDLRIVKNIITRPLEDDVFQLVNAVVNKNKKKAFEIWRDLCVLNKEPIAIIGALASQFRFLYQVKALQEQGIRNKNDIASQLKVSSGRVYYALETCRKFNLAAIHEQLHALALLDQKIKSGKIDKKMGFELYLLGIKNK